VQVTDDQPQGGRADGHVDQEDPPPVGVGGEQSAERGPGDRGHGPHRGQPGLDLGAFLQRVQVGGEGLHRALQCASAQALDDAEHDQRGHVPGGRAQQGADEEEGGARDEDGFAADGVGQLAVHRQGHRDGQQIAGEQPGEDGEAAEVADDLRDRGGHDSGVERGQGHGQHQRGDDRAAPGGRGVLGDLVYRGFGVAHRLVLSPCTRLPATAWHAGRVVREGGHGARAGARRPRDAPRFARAVP